MMSPARITTFYSYKGGVGRSMALANVAVLMARAGRRVLMMDFDIDAPGLHHYFPGPVVRAGVVDLFDALRLALDRAFAGEGSFIPDDPACLDQCRAIVRASLANDAYFHGTGEADLTLMPAGQFDEGYADRIRGLDWPRLFSEFGEVFAILRDELRTRYDEVLIDSRTGLTDVGSVSTVVLPDRLIVVFTPNDQSIAGGAKIARQAFQLHQSITDIKRAATPLDIVPLLSRVERGEVLLRNEWIARAAATYHDLFCELYGAEGVDMARYFDDIHIPYSTYYSFGERIAVADAKDRGFGSVDHAYHQLHRLLGSSGAMVDWKAHTQAPPALEDVALLVELDARVALPRELGFPRVVHVPEHPDPLDLAQLRDATSDAELWRDYVRTIDLGVQRATQGLRGGLHVFGMMPYAAAAVLGRRLDDLARSVPVHLYHFQNGYWALFSSPAAGAPASGEKVYQVIEELAVPDARDGVLVAIEGMRPIATEQLVALAKERAAGFIIRLRQVSPEPLQMPAQTTQAVRELRRELTRLQSRYPTAVFHIVATAPLPLLVELGRMLSPTVFRSAIVYQYQSQTGRYIAGVDVVEMARGDGMNG